MIAMEYHGNDIYLYICTLMPLPLNDSEVIS